jgi:hypothetical protein|tara:strand:+ start:529 stop:633 length:105 start_codon:yes stop_codon:yes gene_type:complete
MLYEETEVPIEIATDINHIQVHITVVVLQQFIVR